MKFPSENHLLPCLFPGGCLRRFRHSDLGAFQAYRSIPELGRYQGWLPMHDEEALAFLAEMEAKPMFQRGQWVQLAIADPHTDMLVGDIGVYLSEDGQTGKVGYTLAPSAQGRGVATAAVREALRLFFAATSASLVLGITDTRNTRSIRLLERLGFKHRETQSVVFHGEECLEEVFELTKTMASQTAAANGLQSDHSSGAVVRESTPHSTRIAGSAA